MDVLEQVLQERAYGIQLQSANDYRAYRHLKAKHLARARRGLKIQVRPNKNHKTTWKPKPVTSENVQGDVMKYAKVLVSDAEREWGKAMESKAVQETKESGSVRQVRRHVISKLAKALKYANELSQGVEKADGISDSDKLQVFGYKSLIDGTLRFEQKAWGKAIESLSAARIVMQVLNTEEMRDCLSAQVDPALSVAVYQSAKTRSVDIPTLAKQTVAQWPASSPIVAQINKVDPSALDVNPSRQDPCAQLGGVQWRSHSATVTNPDLASAILVAREKESLDRTKIANFDTVLQAWQDALDLVKQVIDQDKDDEALTQHHYIVQTSISYNLLFIRLQRDLQLVKQLDSSSKNFSSNTKRLEHNRDKVRILDTMLQSTTNLLQLSGVDRDEELLQSLISMEAFFKAQRTKLVAEAYGLSVEHRVASLALYKLALDTLNGATGIKVEFPGQVVTEEHLKSLYSEMTKELQRAHGLAVLANGEKKAAQQQPVIDSLDRFATGDPKQVLSNLVDPNPTLKPAPSKPVFFDIALNYIEYDESDRTQVEPAAPAAASPSTAAPDHGGQKKKGLFGLFGSK